MQGKYGRRLWGCMGPYDRKRGGVKPRSKMPS